VQCQQEEGHDLLGSASIHSFASNNEQANP